MSRAPFGAVAVAVLLTASTAPTLAQPAGFQKQYKAAVKLENTGDVTAALAAFEAIPSDKRDFNTRLHIASCKKKLGRLLAAEADYKDIQDDPKADQATKDTAASDLEDLRPRIPRLRISVAAGTQNVEVTVDATVIVLPIEHRVDPGPHVVVATHGNKVVFERKMELAEGTTVDVAVDAPIPVGPTVPPIAARTPDDVAAPERRSPVIPFLVGGVLLGGAAASFALALSARSDAKDACAAQTSATCDQTAAGVDRVRTWETVGWIAGGIGLVAIGVGVVLIASPSGRDHATSTARLAPGLGGLPGFTIEGSF